MRAFRGFSGCLSAWAAVLVLYLVVALLLVAGCILWTVALPFRAWRAWKGEV